MNYLVLVNKENEISKNYYEELELVETVDVNTDTIFVEKEAYDNFSDLKQFLKSKNLDINIVSAYRSMEEQCDVMEEMRAQFGDEYVNKFVAKPGYSEHHTGLAIDVKITSTSHKPKNKLERVIFNRLKYATLHRYLEKFGFILRYPKGKEEETGFAYEPWHIRYVGHRIAKIMKEENLTLEAINKMQNAQAQII